MRLRTALYALAGLVAHGISCATPSDQSGDYRVVVEPITNLFAGDTVQALAHVVDAAGGEVRGVAIAFGSSDPTVATVSSAGQVVATGAGNVSVLAWAPGMGRAAPGRTRVPVHGAIEIDSVSPRRVRYGSQLLLYGVGLDPAGAAIVTTGVVTAPIASYSPADPTSPSHYGVLRVIIVPPLGKNSDEVTPLAIPITVTTTRGVASLTANLVIEPRDIYEPNDSVPADLGVIDGRFEALGLAFDKLDTMRASLPVDWYKFTTLSQQDWTITLKGEDGSQAFPSVDLVEGPLVYSEANYFGLPIGLWYTDRPSLRLTGTDGSCFGFMAAFDPTMDLQTPGWNNYGTSWTAVKRQLRFAVKDLPAGTHHLWIGFNGGGGIVLAPGTSEVDTIFRSALGAFIFSQSFDPIRYDLIIEPGIHTELPADRFEGNDFCENAPTLLSLDTTAFTDSVVAGLTLGAELDADWYVVQSHTPGRLYLTVESDDQNRKNSPFLMNPIPGVGQPVTVMYLEGDGRFEEEQELRSRRDFLPGVFLEARSYYLFIEGGMPRSYRLRFGWQPGATGPAALLSPDAPRVWPSRARTIPRW